MELKFKSFYHMLEKLPDDNSCRIYLEKLRWNDNPQCPFCSCKKHYKLRTKGTFNGLYKCANCRQRYTVTVGTMFESSKIGLRKWFIAIFIFQSHKNGISSHQLAKDLCITQKSAWFLLHRIRVSMQEKSNEKFDGDVEVDETFVGGKNKNRHMDKKVKYSQGRSFKDKVPILGIMRKPNPTINIQHHVRCFVVRNTASYSLNPIIRSNVIFGNKITTDEWGAYKSLNLRYKHSVVEHNKKQYVSKDGDTTNRLEGFWTWIKRTYVGTYHFISKKHMQSYANEIAFRYNYLKMNEVERFNLVLNMTQKSKITYKQLIKS